jgi:hypothetical protein
LGYLAYGGGNTALKEEVVRGNNMIEANEIKGNGLTPLNFGAAQWPGKAKTISFLVSKCKLKHETKNELYVSLALIGARNNPLYNKPNYELLLQSQVSTG